MIESLPIILLGDFVQKLSSPSFLIVGILLLQVTLSGLLLFKINFLEQQVAVLTDSFSLNANQLNDIGSTRVEGVSVDDDPALGSPNAQVTIVEFSDFGCSFCAQFHKEVFPQLKAQYIDTGKVRFVYRDFPITQLHPQAQRAAEAANCAGEQGKFWEYHNKLFSTQKAWQKGSDSADLFKEYAVNLDLDRVAFEMCLASGKFKTEIEEDFGDGKKYGVKGTPAFFIDGRMIEGYVPFGEYVKVVEEEIRQ